MNNKTKVLAVCLVLAFGMTMVGLPFGISEYTDWLSAPPPGYKSYVVSFFGVEIIRTPIQTGDALLEHAVVFALNFGCAYMLALFFLKKRGSA